MPTAPGTDVPTGLIPPSLSSLDLTRHDSLKGILLRINVVFVTFILVTLSLRMYVRLVVLRSAGWDDFLLALGVASAIVLSAFCIEGSRHGLGKHIWDLNLLTIIVELKFIVKDLLVCQVMYGTAITITKLSIVLSYLRIFPQTIFRRICYAIGTFLILVWITSVLVPIFQCQPIASAWDFTISPRKCINIVDYVYFSAASTLLTDALLVVIPLPLLYKMNMQHKRKIALYMLFAVGSFACVASALRFSQIHNLTPTGIDISYLAVSPLIWSVVEVGISIICSSVPAIRPLFNVLHGKLPVTLPSKSKSSSYFSSSFSSSGKRAWSKVGNSLGSATTQLPSEEQLEDDNRALDGDDIEKNGGENAWVEMKIYNPKGNMPGTVTECISTASQNESLKNKEGFVGADNENGIEPGLGLEHASLREVRSSGEDEFREGGRKWFRYQEPKPVVLAGEGKRGKERAVRRIEILRSTSYTVED